MQKWFYRTLVYAALAVLLTWPAAGQLGDVIPGSDRTDTWNSLWSLNFWAEQLASGRVPWDVERLNFPEGGSLLIADPLGATLVAPVVWLFGPYVAFSILALMQLMFSGLVMHGFAEAFLTWRRGAGGVGTGPLVSGVAFMSAPLLASHLHNGASEAWSAGWTVLAIWMVWADATQPSRRRMILAAVALFGASLAHWYGGIVAFIFAASIVLLGVGERPQVGWLRRLAGLLLGLTLTGALAAGTAQIHRADDNIVEIKSTEMVRFTTRSTGAADPLTYVLPGEHRSPDFRKMSANNERYLHAHYVGLVVLGLGVWGWVRRRRHTGFLVWGGATCLILSLGPVLMHSARPVLILGDLGVPLPFLLLESFPGFGALSLPWKFALGPVIGLSILAGLAIDQRGRRTTLIAMSMITLDVLVMAPTAERSRVVSVDDDASLRGLRAAPPGAVINYPLAPGRGYLAEQLVHQKPIAGMLNRVGNEPAARLWKRIRAESRKDPDTFHRAVSSTAERLGIRYVVIHTDPDAEPDMYTSAVIQMERLFDVPEWGQGQTRVIQLW